MAKLRIHEAILAHKSRTNTEVTLVEIAEKIWPESDTLNSRVLMSKLANGHRKQVSIETVKIICETLQVSPDFLFGYSNGKFDW